jgi:hypothetical protein
MKYMTPDLDFKIKELIKNLSESAAKQCLLGMLQILNGVERLKVEIFTQIIEDGTKLTNETKGR